MIQKRSIGTCNANRTWVKMATMLEMDDLEFVRVTLNAIGRKGWPDVAVGADVPRATIAKIAYRHTENPRHLTVRKLAAYLRTTCATSTVNRSQDSPAAVP